MAVLSSPQRLSVLADQLLAFQSPEILAAGNIGDVRSLQNARLAMSPAMPNMAALVRGTWHTRFENMTVCYAGRSHVCQAP